MPRKDSFEAMVNEGLGTSVSDPVDPTGFEEGIHRKVQARRQKRRVFQATGLIVLFAGFGGIIELTSPSPQGLPRLAASEVSQEPSPIGETEMNLATVEDDLTEWEEDPFETWNEDMPADYDLVAGI